MDLKRIKLNISSLHPAIYLLLFVFIFNVTFIELNWGYDEFGPIISHLELDNEVYINEYRSYLAAIGIKNQALSDFILYILFPIFVVPIRWTYALGISPLLGLPWVANVDWPTIGSILLIPNILLSIIGVYLVSLSLKNNSYSVINIFCILILLSHPFMKWTLTLSAYSSHLFCFGLLLYSEVKLKHKNKKLFGSASIARSVVQIFNYQYIVVVGFVGLIELIKSPISFFKNRKYISWLLPASISISSVIFLFFRSNISGKHSNPAYGNLSSSEVDRYDFIHNSDNFLSSLEFIANRCLDFIYYFWLETTSYYGSGSYFELSLITWISLLIIGVVLIRICWSKIDKNLVFLTLAILFSLFIPYLIGIQPMTPTRHSLVLLLPIALLIALVISSTLSGLISTRYMNISSSVILLVFSFLALGFNQFKQNSLDMEKTQLLIEKYSVQEAVLAPCNLRPLLYNQFRNNYKIVYRCGPKIVQKISPNVNRVVTLSEREISFSAAIDMIHDYSDFTWRTIKESNEINNCDNINQQCKSSFWIFDKID